jgi:serine/threonine protein kinase
MNKDENTSTLPMSQSGRSEESPDEASPLTRPLAASASDKPKPIIQNGAIEPTSAKDSEPLLIDNRFAVQKELRRGGIGVTYLAIDTKDNNTPVVVKVLLQRNNEIDAEWVERKFRGEIEALKRIHHRGIVEFVGEGVMPDGKFYLAMEYVEGSELRAFIKPGKGVDDFARIANFICQLGEAINAAHEAGVYHRDLKPENIMVTCSGNEEQIKVIDFGIATVKESLDEKTKTTVLAGTPAYLAPEQINDKPTAASDVYALGVIAYEMVTGRVPFDPDRPNLIAKIRQLLEMQLRGVRNMPRDLRPSLTERAQAIILRALAYDRKQRYGSAKEFGTDLAKALDESSIGVPGNDPPPYLEMAYVLFMDIVGYSKLPMDLQTEYLRQLQEVVRSSSAFQQGQLDDRLIPLPTGDGMALAFFGDPLAAICCAFEVSEVLKGYPHIELRMGVNTGPVYRFADINANRNVVGGGINVAQRVMDCGDARHILVSQTVASVLLELGEWRNRLHDLGTHPVKHGVLIHLYNVYSDTVGNSSIPTELVPKTDPPPQPKPRISLALRVVLAIILIAATLTAVWFARGKPDGRVLPHTLSYWALAQMYKNNKPYGEPVKLFGSEMYFRTGDELQFFVTSSDSGHLYLLSEEPSDRNSGSYFLLFPTPKANNSSSQIQPNSEVATDRNFFDATVGTEKVWIVWSASAIPEIETEVSRWKDKGYLGEISEPTRVELIKNLIEERSRDEAYVEQDDRNNRMNIKGRGNVVVRLVTLAHR